MARDTELKHQLSSWNLSSKKVLENAVEMVTCKNTVFGEFIFCKFRVCIMNMEEKVQINRHGKGLRFSEWM